METAVATDRPTRYLDLADERLADAASEQDPVLRGGLVAIADAYIRLAGVAQHA